MTENTEARRVRDILATVKPLAAEYYRLTGKPLGVTGEVAEYVAAELLGLELAPPRTKGYDAVRQTPAGPVRVQIKGRAYGEKANRSQRLTFHLFGALSEFERNLIRERTQAGLTAARARGKKGGRPTALNKDKRDLAVRLYHENTMPIAKVCTMLGISKPTLYAYVRSAEAKTASA